MRGFAVLLLIVAFAPLAAAVEESDGGALNEGLRPLEGLCGEWRGVGEGLWGTAAVERAYKPALDGRFVRGRGQSTYPKQGRNPKGEVHRHLDMFSYDTHAKNIVLRQFDNEGFASTYHLRTREAESDTLVFDSYDLENVPKGWKARITIRFLARGQIMEMFELATKGPEFKLYLTNNLLKMPGRNSLGPCTPAKP